MTKCAKSDAQRQQALRDRRKADGVRQRVFWLNDEQAEKVRRYIEKLRSGRA